MAVRWRTGSSTRWPRLGLAAAVACVAGLVVFEPDRGDVAIYRQGARAAVSTGAVYSFQHQGHGFSYPPFAALVMSPVAWLPNGAMWSVLVMAGIAALAVVLALSLPGLARAVRRRERGACVAVAALIISEPVVTTLRFGQIDLLLAALVMADVLVLRRGVLVGLAAAMKLTPGLFIVFLLIRGRYREAVGAVGTFGAATLWGFAVLPEASARYWAHNALAGTGVGSFTTVGNQSVHGVLSRVLGAGAGTAVWLVLAVPITACGLQLARRAADAGCDVLAVATTGVTACLVSPVSWPHHWVWFVPLLCGLRRLGAGDRVLTNWVVGAIAFAAVSQFVPLKAVGIGYVPIALVLLAVQRDRFAGRTTVHPSDTVRSCPEPLSPDIHKLLIS